MNIKKIRTIAVATLALAALAMSANAAPVIEFSTSTVNAIVGGDGSVGWSFQTNQAITVTALNVFDPTGTGNVRLYDILGTVLASATLTTGNPLTGSPTPFYSASITPVSLAANTNYFIAQDTISGTTLLNYLTGTLTVDPAITYLGAVSAQGLGLNPVNDYFAQGFSPAWFGPNFEIARTGVPEPVALSIFGAGLLTAGAMRRRRKSKAA